MGKLVLAKNKKEQERVRRIAYAIGISIVLLYLIGILFLPKQPTIDEEYTLPTHALRLRTIPFYMYAYLSFLFILTLVDGSHSNSISRGVIAKIVFVICFWCVELITQNFFVLAIIQTISAALYVMLNAQVGKEKLLYEEEEKRKKNFSPKTESDILKEILLIDPDFRLYRWQSQIDYCRDCWSTLSDAGYKMPDQQFFFSLFRVWPLNEEQRWEKWRGFPSLSDPF